MPITPPTDGYTPSGGAYYTVEMYMLDTLSGEYQLAGQYGFSFDPTPDLIDQIVATVLAWLGTQYPEATHYRVMELYTGTSQVTPPAYTEIPA